MVLYADSTRVTLVTNGATVFVIYVYDRQTYDQNEVAHVHKSSIRWRYRLLMPYRPLYYSQRHIYRALLEYV